MSTPARHAALLVSALSLCLLALPSAAPATSIWVWPITPAPVVMIPYLAPATPYAAGHRGLDLKTERGSPIVAPAAGVVVFAGVVVDRPVVSIAHAGDLISSFEPMTASVSVGDRVAGGQQIGTVASGGHCAECLHFGVRLHGAYVSPLLLLGGIRRAVLLPLGP